ncbi:hypothetical protein M422DRAFT_252230 [Sphaerobolus stellatus SS14]|uniref:Large ribosomal subunit protein mL49 n=1 Tax=Sphaerobolus stellatus (strain SS14) TaxID=990650 RepID=A0A0C9VB67_SPHS4|nr:hypothetical protein M422DRAFT_252230 [Sphaerobolus stellatus SS14]
MSTKFARKSYQVARNSRGALPVYSDIRNAGTRYQIQVRNVMGDANALLLELKKSLFPPGSYEAAALRGSVVRGRHIILQGPKGSWRNNVAEWLETRGF